MRYARIITVVSVIAFPAGCAKMEHRHVQSQWPAECPKQSAAALAAEQNRLGPLSDTQTLACALTTLRDTQDASLLGTALGSRLCLHLAEREASQDKREKLANEGVSFAETALAHGGAGDGAVHYYLAANLGLAVRDHITRAMNNLGRLESELRQALALSPDIDYGGPLRVLGALYLKAPPWPGGIGDLDQALELLGTAVKKHPQHPLNHLFYAQALWGEEDEAKLTQVKNELALGKKLLQEGNWGYNRETWENEFAEFAQELGQTALSH